MKIDNDIISSFGSQQKNENVDKLTVQHRYEEVNMNTYNSVLKGTFQRGADGRNQRRSWARTGTVAHTRLVWVNAIGISAGEISLHSPFHSYKEFTRLTN